MALTSAVLRVTFGHGSVIRGEDYARRGMVTALRSVASEAATVLQAKVRGSGFRPYETVVTVRHGGSVTSLCTCPVGVNCKHGAAVVFAAQRREPEVQAWQQAVRQVTAGVRPPEEITPLALQVERGGPDAAVMLRALTMGARGKWIKTGAAWDDLANVWGSRWDEDQRRALNELGRLRLAYSSYYYRGGPDLLSITLFGPAVWSALRRVVESGVGIVSGRDTPPVRSLADPVEIPADDIPLFAAGFLPSLRRAVPVAVADDVELPEAHPPVVRVEVSFLPGHVTELRWGFRYGIGDQVIDVAAAPTRGEPDLRDARAETELVRRLPQRPWAVLDGQTPRLVAAWRMRGPESAVFVSDWLPVLEDDDAVVVTLVGDRPEYRLSEEGPTVTLAVRDPADGADWFSLDVQVSLDGEVIDFPELFAALARGDSHLVLDSGAWFSLDRPELDQLRAVIAEAALLQTDGAAGLRLRAEHAGLWEELVALGVVAEQSSAWRRAVSGLLDLTAVPQVALPQGLTATLRPYQLIGYHWLTFLWETRLGGILADDMGLGKTVQLLAAILRAREEEPDSPPVLVVAPTSVVPTWAAQARMFAPGLRLEVVERTSAKRAELLKEVRLRADIVVTSYTLLRLDEDESGAQPWAAVIFDEAQFVKNRQAATYK